MTTLHIANTNFEFELRNGFSETIEESWSKNTFCLQLQFLPLLFATENDQVAVTRLPSKTYLNHLKQVLEVEQLPRLVTFKEKENFQNLSCLSWGPSQQIDNWTARRQIPYQAPKDWSMVKNVNSKSFSSAHSPSKTTCLISNLTDLQGWLEKESYPKVLKTCFGLSGIGHLIINQDFNLKRVLDFCHPEWSLNLPLIGEPWLKRVFDFSTQWFLSPNGKTELIGSTVFQTEKNGGYTGTFAGHAEILFGPYLSFLHSHIEIVQQLLKDLAVKGYFGHMGVDALLYRCKDDNLVKLYPIVEINGRQTLSLVALKMQQMRCPNQLLHLSFQKSADSLSGLLPQSLGSDSFKRNLVVQPLTNHDQLTQLHQLIHLPKS